jgi:hypothetical protein
MICLLEEDFKFFQHELSNSLELHPRMVELWILELINPGLENP